MGHSLIKIRTNTVLAGESLTNEYKVSVNKTVLAKSHSIQEWCISNHPYNDYQLRTFYWDAEKQAVCIIKYKYGKKSGGTLLATMLSNLYNKYQTI